MTNSSTYCIQLPHEMQKENKILPPVYVIIFSIFVVVSKISPNLPFYPVAKSEAQRNTIWLKSHHVPVTDAVDEVKCCTVKGLCTSREQNRIVTCCSELRGEDLAL